MKIEERYSRNAEAFSAEEMARIRKKSACIIGCGGLGGHVIQSLARFGVGRLTIVDGDVFTESNLNRQIFSNAETLGQNKARVIQATLVSINPDVAVTAVPEMLTAENGAEILAGHDLAVDCLDNVSVRMLAAELCTKLEIPMVHGAIGGFFGQVANIFPGDQMMRRVYPKGEATELGAESALGNPAFMSQIVAGIQCCEGLKMLAGRGNILRNDILFIDLLENSSELVHFE